MGSIILAVVCVATFLWLLRPSSPARQATNPWRNPSQSTANPSAPGHDSQGDPQASQTPEQAGQVGTATGLLNGDLEDGMIANSALQRANPNRPATIREVGTATAMQRAMRNQ